MIWYVYPMWHKVSFTLVAESHITELKKYMYVYPIDEVALGSINPATKPLLVLHPFFYPMVKYAKQLEHLLNRIRGIIGVDVADSDRISNLAVSMTHYAEAMIVPSTWAKQSYLRSGVRVPVYVVPHGVEGEWFHKPRNIEFFTNLLDIKQKNKLIYLLFFCWHSEYRKGLDLVLEAYKNIRKERKDIVLIAKFMTPNGYPHMVIRRLGGIIVSGWLSEEQKMELYDIADIYLLFSRGGGFELNGLEALARGEVVLAADEGSWVDYLPSFTLIPSKPCPWVLKDNPIHSGKGREIIVEKAVDKILEVIDNLEDYKARIREHVEKKVSKVFTWENTGRKLAEILRKYL